MDLIPRQRAGKPGFVVNIPANPLKPTGVWTCRGMGTREKADATAIAKDAGLLLERPDIIKNPLKHLLDLSGYHPKAVALILGKDHPATLKMVEMKNSTIGLTSEDLTEIRDRIVTDNQDKKSDYDAHPEKYTEWETDSETGSAVPMHTWPLEQIDPELVERILKQFMPEKVKSLNERVVEVERDNVTLKARAEQAERELAELRRDLNRHVNITLAKAIDDWYASSDFLNLAGRTQHETRRAVDSFLATLPTGFKLADLTAARVLEWRDGLRPVEGDGTLSARTLVKNTMYLRSFVTAAYVRYDLRENPMNKISPPGGANSRRESVVAIHSHTELVELLDTVESVDKSYWYPLIATAVLAGPRYSELVWIRKSDLNMDQGYIRVGARRDDDGKVVGGTKTGLERRVPIEQTRLHGILEKYLRGGDKTSKWLFPCHDIGPSTIVRTKTPEGIWSDGSNFHNALDEVIKKCKKKTGDRHYWNYGPREWRHCAGTAMGHSGNDSARVSSWLGNSETVCRRFYCVAPTSGKLWPFKW
jgi:integrase